MRYAGSKALRAPDIVAAIPDDVEHYVEPFCGSLCVFQRVIRQRPHLQSYLLNDIDPDLIAWVQMVRGDDTTHGDFIERLAECRDRLLPENEHEPEIREEFERSKDRWLFDGDPFAWFFLRVYALGQFVFRDRSNIASFDPRYFGSGIASETVEKAQELRAMLGQADVSCSDALGLLRDLDESSFVYLDPPYLPVDRCPKLYPIEMTEAEHIELASILRTARFRFLLSMGDTFLARDIYVRDRGFCTPFRHAGGFQVRTLLYTRTGRKTWRGAVSKTMEWLVSNYDRPSDAPGGRPHPRGDQRDV